MVKGQRTGSRILSWLWLMTKICTSILWNTSPQCRSISLMKEHSTRSIFAPLRFVALPECHYGQEWQAITLMWLMSDYHMVGTKHLPVVWSNFPGGYPKFVSQGFNDAYLPVWLQEAGYNTYYTGKFLNAHTTANWNNPFPKGWNGTDCKFCFRHCTTKLIA